MIAAFRRAQYGLQQTRRLTVACGVVGLLALAFIPEGSLADRLALVALVALGLATAVGYVQLFLLDRTSNPKPDAIENAGSRTWLYVTVGVALVSGVAVQSWFHPGTSIAGGDIQPPDATAWLGRLFEPWAWTGSNLGEASQLPLNLPWAAVLAIVQGLGGDPATAQRIWYTGLFMGAALGALSLLAALRLGPIASFAGAMVYLLNPYVVSEVNVYANYLAALGLLAAMPAALVAAGTRRLSVRWAAGLIALASPLLGYVFSNPPLVGMLLGAILTTPLLVAWIDGREAALRSFRALLLALVLLLATSTYWIVPAVLHLSGFAGAQLASLSSWSWTEGRATLRNAFWLNAFWAWSFPEYFPYASAYDGIALKVAEFVLPAIAFGALALPVRASDGSQRFRRERELRLAVAAAAIALIVIFISTGTNAPGSVLFIRLYNLPFGWLLREPGRFLMLVALAYSVLSGVVVQATFDGQSFVQFAKSRHASAEMFRFAFVPLILASSVLLGFPLYTGSVAPDSRPVLPPIHIKMPAYWSEMARFVDGLPVQGGILVMPPDDFYSMPYSWGYYGTDSFVADMFHRPVLVPNPQGYIPTTPQLLGAVNLTARSMLNGDWRQAETLVRAFNTPLVLVRRDIDMTFPSRSILAPNDLASALRAAPNFVLVRQIGSLDLFSLTSATSEGGVAAKFATINTQTPDLRLLPLIGPDTALVTSGTLAGVSNVVQAPPLELWKPNGLGLVWQTTVPKGWADRIAELGSKTVVPLDRSGALNADISSAKVGYSPATNFLTVSIEGQSAIGNGDFAGGVWPPQGDCHDVNVTEPGSNARVLAHGAPGGLPALQISATLGSACAGTPLDWRGGPLVLAVMIHHVQGVAPRVCIWEFGPNRCASLPTIPDQNGWSTYRASVMPDAGTRSISLFLYADAGLLRSRTINEYSDVRVLEVPALPTFALLSDPEGQAPPSVQLGLVDSSFSAEWQGSISGEHVLVDGMLNGWLIPIGSNAFSAHYTPANAFQTAQWVSLAALLAILLIPAWPWAARQLRRSYSQAKRRDSRGGSSR